MIETKVEDRFKTPAKWQKTAARLTKALTANDHGVRITTRNDIVVKIIDDDRPHDEDCPGINMGSDGTITPCDHLAHAPIAWHTPKSSDIVINACLVDGMHDMDPEAGPDNDWLDYATEGYFYASDDAHIVNRIIGVLTHEGAHSMFSHWIMEDWFANNKDGRLTQTMLLLEELRIEHMQSLRHDNLRAMMRVSSQMLLPDEKEMADMADEDGKVSLRAIGGKAALVLGRTDRGILMKREVTAFQALCEDVLGHDRLSKMAAIWREFSGIKDHKEAKRKMPDLARQWNELFPEEEEPLMIAGLGGMMSEAIDQTVERATSWPGDMNEDHAPDEMANGEKQAAKTFGETKPTATGEDPKDEQISHGYGEGSYGSTTRRKPTAEEQARASKLARLLERLSLRNRTVIKLTSKTPPGRISMRSAVQQAADHAQGRLSPVDPFSRTRRKHNTTPKLTVGIGTDVSGSMRWATEFSASTAWIMARAIRHINGKSAGLVYGERVEPTMAPNGSLDIVTVREACDGHEEGNDAIAALDGALGLSNARNGVRILFIVSDGVYGQTGEMAAVAKWVDTLVASGCIVVWVTHYEERDYAGFPCVPKGAHKIIVDRHSPNYDKMFQDVVREIEQGLVA